MSTDGLVANDGGERAVSGETATAGIWTTFPAAFLGAGNGLLDQVESGLVFRYSESPHFGMARDSILRGSSRIIAVIYVNNSIEMHCF